MTNQVQVASAKEFSPGQRKLVFINGRSIVLFNIGGTYRAIDNSCPHNGASLAGGRLDGTVLQCPAHGLRFDLAKPSEPGRLCLHSFPVDEIDGKVMLQLDSADTP
ncbi:Rieske (2Fe-2S) protein [Cupriavidus oxalaticus]|uniref:Rieske (2Fe-2S) protein n=2 Tax=Cupriavidus oxalaticus TaxID=96344 RepID=A0A5P3VI25_9BURK|nr:Rieske (2Fe-2S) protein [Cupriavidus oxalaticus]